MTILKKPKNTEKYISWQIHYPRMSANDTRRDKRRCVYYLNAKCYCDDLVWYGKKCRGSSQCPKYKEKR